MTLAFSAHARQTVDPSGGYTNHKDCVSMKVLTDDFTEIAAKKECEKLGFSSKAANDSRGDRVKTAELLNEAEGAL